LEGLISRSCTDYCHHDLKVIGQAALHQQARNNGVTGSSRESTTGTQDRSTDISIHLSPARQGGPDSLRADSVAPTIHRNNNTFPAQITNRYKDLEVPTTLLRTSITLYDAPRDKCKLKLASSTESGCSQQDSSVRHLALPVSPSLAVLLFLDLFSVRHSLLRTRLRINS
jgi:hypothetical protein